MFIFGTISQPWALTSNIPATGRGLVNTCLLGFCNLMMSSSKKLGWCCFDCFCGGFCNQEMLLSINFHSKSILQRKIMQFRPVPTKNKSKNWDTCKRTFASAGVSLHRQFYGPANRICLFLRSSFQFEIYATLKASPQWIGSFPANRCDRSTKSKTGWFQLSSVYQFDWPSNFVKITAPQASNWVYGKEKWFKPISFTWLVIQRQHSPAVWQLAFRAGSSHGVSSTLVVASFSFSFFVRIFSISLLSPHYHCWPLQLCEIFAITYF